MNEYTKKSDLNPEEVIKLADDFFGQDGLGMIEQNKSENGKCFQGEEGRVEITACKEDRTEVKLETKELDWQIKKFIDLL